jgi:3-oxoacyl-[acyl-carrier-protein] synthase III
MKLERPLGINGTGLVLPAAQPQQAAGLATGPHTVRRVDLNREPLSSLQREPRVRRASPITIFMLAAAQQALAAAGSVDRAKLGIVAAFHTGLIVATRRFYEGILKNGQRFASPNLFPETVFNSATSHLATVLGVSGPCYSVLGDDSAWVNAVGVAACWLANRSVEHALVIGAEEFDPLELDAYAHARWLRRNGSFVASEGAGALLLRRANQEDAVVVTHLAEGFTYRRAQEAREQAARLFAGFQGGSEVCLTAQHTWLADIEAQTHRKLKLRSAPLPPDHGQAFAASAAWDTVWAAERVRATRQPILVPVWGLSEQCSALLLSGASHI